MGQFIDRERYLADFPSKKREEALRQALDIRKFEIELYWKRATYFWAFIAVGFAGYFGLQKDGDSDSIYVIACLGFIFSLAWYLVNRGSGAWQRNWEAHVDLLEDDIMGPLYKTLINRRAYRFWHLAEPYGYSPSRINNLLALVVVATWLVLMARTLLRAEAVLQSHCLWTIIAMSVCTIAAAIALLFVGYSRKTDDPIKIYRRQRTYI